MLATVTHDHPGDWEHYIRKVCLAYNSSVHSATGFSPFFLMFRREAKLPVDLMYGSNRMEKKPVAEYAWCLKDGLQSAYALVREHCKAEHRRQKDIYDERVYGKAFCPGDLVWLHSPAVPRGHSRYRTYKYCSQIISRLPQTLGLLMYYWTMRTNHQPKTKIMCPKGQIKTIQPLTPSQKYVGTHQGTVGFQIAMDHTFNIDRRE